MRSTSDGRWFFEVAATVLLVKGKRPPAKVPPLHSHGFGVAAVVKDVG
jgi:hypothetical protein